VGVGKECEGNSSNYPQSKMERENQIGSSLIKPNAIELDPTKDKLYEAVRAYYRGEIDADQVFQIGMKQMEQKYSFDVQRFIAVSEQAKSKSI
jgi:hypothetical protein